MPTYKVVHIRIICDTCYTLYEDEWEGVENVTIHEAHSLARNDEWKIGTKITCPDCQTV